MMFVIPTDPIPLARPRVVGGHAFLPPRSRQYRQLIQTFVMAQMIKAKLAPMAGELVCKLKFFRTRPVTAPNYGDIDNLAKAVLDALSGLLYSDDRQIVSLTAEKFTDRQNPRAEILIETKNFADP